MTAQLQRGLAFPAIPRGASHASRMSLWCCALACLSPSVLAQAPPTAGADAKNKTTIPQRAAAVHSMPAAEADRNALAAYREAQEASAVEPAAEMDGKPMRDSREPAKASDSGTPAKHSMPMPPVDKNASEESEALETSSAPMSEAMDMGSMADDRAPADARDPDAYAEGYEYTGMPGLEHTDQIAFGYGLADEFEFLSGNEGEGFAWSLQANYGDDRNKLWLRTQGLKVRDGLDATTSGEVLWWRPYSPFWGSQLGIRQDFGPGARTYLAAGIQGLSPYWFDIEATAYVGEDGRLSARFKASYDILFTNRLILTPSAEANAYSKADDERGLGAGLGNVEAGLRLRYEAHRKFAPYVGYVWERALSGTADRLRADGEPIKEHRFVVGIRMWL